MLSICLKIQKTFIIQNFENLLKFKLKLLEKGSTNQFDLTSKYRTAELKNTFAVRLQILSPLVAATAGWGNRTAS